MNPQKRLKFFEQFTKKKRTKNKNKRKEQNERNGIGTGTTDQWTPKSIQELGKRTIFIEI